MIVPALQWLFALVLAVTGLALVVGGGRLVLLGGSAYYAIVGLLLMTSAVLLWRRRLSGVYVFAAAYFGTVLWSVWEAGFDAWALLPRIGLLTAFGAWLLLPVARRGLAPPASDRAVSHPQPRFRAPLLSIAAVALAVAGGWALRSAGPAPQIDPIYQAGTRSARPVAVEPQYSRAGADEWGHYGRDRGGSRFSPAAQITTANVGRLEVAWTYRTGPAPSGYGTFEATPLEVGNALYLCTGYNDVIALDADSGREIWRHRTQVDPTGVAAFTCRGVAHHRVPGATGACAERIYTGTVDARLIALDARDGRPCSDFGAGGSVSLLAGMGEVTPGYYYVTSAPTVVRGTIVVGGWVADGQHWGEPSGVIRAFDAITGRLAWAFDAGRPDRQGEPGPGERYTPATPNSWAPMSADEELGLVFAPTGNATPDYYGARRRPFDDRYSSSVVALDAETGKVRWSFQTVHHDLWDYDVGSQPTLVDLPTAQGVRKALVQPTKRGDVFVLDRTTGEPIWRVVERPVPQAGAPPGQRLSKTQPFLASMPSFRGPDLTERSMWGLTPLDQLWCRIRFREARYDGPFTPIGEQWTVVYPGFSGGHNWGSASVDPDRQVMVLTSLRLASYHRLMTRAEADARGLRAQRPATAPATAPVASDAAPPPEASFGTRFFWPQEGTPYAADTQAFFSPLEVPCQQPPWGLLSAVDLATGQVLWHRPLGTAQDSGPLSMRLGLKLPIGTPNSGGAITTAGGLTFVAAALDAYLRAYDTDSGELLWEGRLPAGGQATPMTYTTDRGRQLVVIAAGGMGLLKTRTGDFLVAFALPRDRD